MLSRTLMLTLVGTTMLLDTSPARAQTSVEVGPFGSYTRLDPTLGFGQGFGVGGRLSVLTGPLTRRFVVEGELGWTPGTNGALSIHHMPLRGRLLYSVPIDGRTSLLLGGGGVRNSYTRDGNTVDDAGYTIMAGMRRNLTPDIALRVDAVLDYMANPVNESPAVERNTNRAVEVGVMFRLREQVVPRRSRVRRLPPQEARAPEPAQGKPIKVDWRDVTFAEWDDEINPAAQAALDRIAEQLMHVDFRIEVSGHTDSGGPRKRNLKLSVDRARSVRAYLVMKGVPADRLIARGYGPDRPVASNDTPQGRAMNRRVELRRID